MTDLFSTHLAVNQQNISYRVIFADERYTFLSEGGQNEFSTFSFKREHDEWLDQNQLPQDLKDQATEALDNYLLQQL